MTRIVPWDDIPDSAVVPDGAYAVQIGEILESQTAGGDEAKLPAGCLMYRATYWIATPEQFNGYPLYDNFVVGTADDPLGDDPETWKRSIGARRFKRLFKAAQVPFAEEIDHMCQVAQGQQLVVVVTQQTTPRGSILNQVQSYYALGEREVGLEQAQTASTPRARKPATRPAAPQAAPPRAAPPPPAARPAPPAPAPPANPRGGKAAAPALTRCAVCGEHVPRNEFAAHVKTHQEEE